MFHTSRFLGENLADLPIVNLVLACTFCSAYYIYDAASNDADALCEPTEYFVFTASTGQIDLLIRIRISVIMAELSVLPIITFYLRVRHFLRMLQSFQSNLAR